MKTVFIERPTGAELEELVFLWKTVFGDGEEYIRKFIGTPSYRGCVYASLDGKAVSAVHLTSPLENENFLYGYAAATLEAYRGRGLCRALHEGIFAYCRENYSVYGVHPAEEKLTEFYGKMGMKPSAYRYFSDIEGDGGKLCEISHEEYGFMRDIHFGKLSRDWLELGGYTTVGFEIKDQWCAACLGDGVIWEVIAPPELEGAAARRAATVCKKAKLMTMTDTPVASETALMTYGGKIQGFGLFIE